MAIDDFQFSFVLYFTFLRILSERSAPTSTAKATYSTVPATYATVPQSQ